MKKILSAAFVSLALMGAISTASAFNVPDQDATLRESLHFWQQFADSDS